MSREYKQSGTSLEQTQQGIYTPRAKPVDDEKTRLASTIKQTHPYPFLNPTNKPNTLGHIAHYDIIETLGEGGMGYVFKAEDSQLHRTVALKVMKADLSSQTNAKERFLREARSMAAIRSDNVAMIHQVGEQNNIPYLAMEYLEGQSMEQWIKTHDQTPTNTIVQWGIQICKGLKPAHEKHLIHRDIKPANLWVETPGERIKILDFGLAHALETDSKLTQTGYIIGTLEYMAPEQIESSCINAKTDLFSLGCVLYQLASNTSPFSGPSQIAILKKLASDTPRPLEQIRHDIPHSLSLLISQLMSKKPDARPDSINEVILRLEKIQHELQSFKTDKNLPLSPSVKRHPKVLSVSHSKPERHNGRWFLLIIITLIVSAFYFYQPTEFSLEGSTVSDSNESPLQSVIENNVELLDEGTSDGALLSEPDYSGDEYDDSEQFVDGEDVSDKPVEVRLPESSYRPEPFKPEPFMPEPFRPETAPRGLSRPIPPPHPPGSKYPPPHRPPPRR